MIKGIWRTYRSARSATSNKSGFGCLQSRCLAGVVSELRCCCRFFRFSRIWAHRRIARQQNVCPSSCFDCDAGDVSRPPPVGLAGWSIPRRVWNSPRSRKASRTTTQTSESCPDPSLNGSQNRGVAPRLPVRVVLRTIRYMQVSNSMPSLQQLRR